MRKVKPITPFNNFRYSSPFLEGIATLFNVGGNFYQYKIKNESFNIDSNSLREDWQALAGDFTIAVSKVDKEIVLAQAQQLKLNLD